MREILDSLTRWQAAGEDIAVATLVRVHGSAPRRPGARLCVSRAGGVAGSVSGGCVEADVVRRAAEVLDSKQAAVARYSLAGDAELEVALACGSIEVLIEPFQADVTWRVLVTALAERRAVALATVLDPEFLITRRLVISSDGLSAGSIDPHVDGEIVTEAGKMLAAGGTAVIPVRLAGQAGSVFIEAFLPPERLYIVGATEIGMHLCRMAAELGFEVTVIDPRSVFATEERFPQAHRLLRTWPQEALEGAALDDRAYVVTLTHDFKLDVPALAAALRSKARYIGALGSSRTHARRKARLADSGFTPSVLARIHAPVGLDIGAATPAEIAVAILAEMLAVRNARDGQVSSERGGVVHAARGR